MLKKSALCILEGNLNHSSVDFGKEKFHFRAIFRLDAFMGFVSDIFMMPSTSNAVPPTPLPCEVISNPSFETLIFFFSFCSLLCQRTFWPQANPRQPKYLISNKLYFCSRALDNQPEKRNGKFCRSTNLEGRACLLHSFVAFVSE